ncbi:MAG: SDR family oxidoreductase [Candidatus Melainabacteria bacterium]|nr:SDR family oxidoreductase [Candidatus Melainabacteria bacterium]
MPSEDAFEPQSSQKVYLIFGGTGGIGSVLAGSLAEAGHKVIVTGRDEARLRELNGLPNVDSYSVDITECGAIDQCVSKVFERYGRIDGVANCIGSLLLKPAHLVTDAEWNSIIDVNLTSSFKIVRASVGAMIKTGGSIVLVSSAAATVGLASHEAISAAKAGIEGLAVAAAASYARRNIRVNCVAPGMVETKLTRNLLASESGRRASEAMHALGRIGAPEDISSAIRWLLSSEAAWVTGQVFSIDGGLTTVRPRVAAN